MPRRTSATPGLLAQTVEQMVCVLLRTATACRCLVCSSCGGLMKVGAVTRKLSR